MSSPQVKARSSVEIDNSCNNCCWSPCNKKKSKSERKPHPVTIVDKKIVEITKIATQPIPEG